MTGFERASAIIHNLALYLDTGEVTTLAVVHDELSEVPGLAEYMARRRAGSGQAK